MAPRRKTERRQGDVIGRLVPGELLDTDAVFTAAGIGDAKLMELRRAGAIQPHKFNGRCWYRAEDLIALIVGGEETKPSKRKSSK